MPVRINGSTSGYSQIDAPAIAGDQTFTLPATGGTLDRINRAGNILQVAQTVKSDTFSSATKGSYVAVPGLSVTLTPSSASNKVLVRANVTAGTLNNLVLMFHIYRNGSKITPNGVATGFTPNNAYALFASGTASGAGMSTALPLEFLDSPNTTSSVTYQIYAAVNSTAAANLNVNPTTSSGGGTPGGNSSITVIEVAA
jgi:hypothetical protein